MRLEVLPGAMPPAHWLRLYVHGERRHCAVFGDEMALDFGSLFFAPEMPGSRVGNCALDLTPSAEMPADELLRAVHDHFARRNLTCRRVLANPLMAGGLDGTLESAGYARSEVLVMAMGRFPERLVEAGGLTIIPARASYRHWQRLAEIEAGECGREVRLAIEEAQRDLDDAHQDALIALENGSAVGRVTLLTIGQAGRVGGLYVVPDARRRGIGRTLLGRIIEICQRSILPQIFLAVGAANDPAQRLAGECGFQPAARLAEWQLPG